MVQALSLVSFPWYHTNKMGVTCQKWRWTQPSVSWRRRIITWGVITIPLKVQVWYRLWLNITWSQMVWHRQRCPLGMDGECHSVRNMIYTDCTRGLDPGPDLLPRSPEGCIGRQVQIVCTLVWPLFMWCYLQWVYPCCTLHASLGLGTSGVATGVNTQCRTA